MSQENVELHRLAVAAFNARDVDGFVALCDPGIELHSAVTGAVYNGHEGVRGWHVDLAEAFGEEVWVEPNAYFALGNSPRKYRKLKVRKHKFTLTATDGAGNVSAPRVFRWRVVD